MNNIAIFKTGQHTDSHGNVLDATPDYLRAIAASYQPTLHEAPAVIGHPADNAPAYAWVQSLNYNDAALDDAKKALNRLYSALDKAPSDGETDAAAVAAFNEAMNDDFNTPKAFAVLFDLARRINSGESALAPTLKTLGGRLGLLQQDPATYLKGQNNCGLSEADILARINARAEAKAAKDYARADAIRAELAAQGVIIKDTAGGVEWHYE